MSKNEELEYYLISLRDGNIEALDNIYSLTSKMIFSIALSIVRDSHLAQDIVHDVFLKIRGAIHTYQEGTYPYAWISMIAKNTSLLEIRRRSKEVSFDVDNSEYVFGGYSIQLKEDNPLLNAAMESLNENERTIILLYLVNEYKHREIAKMLDKPLGTVLWTYNNALKKLKKYLNERGMNREN